MNQIKYVKTTCQGEKPVIWAFTEESVLETSLLSYYSRDYKAISRRAATELEAARTKYWTCPVFENWRKKDHGEHTAFNLGKIVSENQRRQRQVT